jgi:hypothetical protein
MKRAALRCLLTKRAALRCLLVCGLWAAAGSAAPSAFTEADFATLDKIDVHVHINSPGSALLDQAAADHFRLLTINVDYPDFPPLPDQSRIAQSLVASHPDTLAYAASFSMHGWDDPGWQEQTIARLDAAFAAGAVAVKVWKNIGMEFRDKQGRLVMIDDPKFDKVFDFIRERHRVLIGHQGEPHNCWLPIARMTVNNDKEYFREHPQYHMFLHPELPSYEDQMAARDRMLAWACPKASCARFTAAMPRAGSAIHGTPGDPHRSRDESPVENMGGFCARCRGARCRGARRWRRRSR